MNTCKFCSKKLQLTNEVDTCVECQARLNKWNNTTLSSSYSVNKEYAKHTIDKKNRIVCECGNMKLKRAEDAYASITLTCNPPINVQVYECIKCGKLIKIHRQEEVPENKPMIYYF